MPRVDILPEFYVPKKIKELRSEIEKLKNRQFVGGNSLVLRYTETNNNWDVDETVSGSASLAQWRVTFTPTNTNRPFTQLCFDWQVTPDIGFNLNQVQGYIDPSTINSSAVSFLIDYANINLDDVNFKIKFGMKSVDTGTITWQRLPDTV